MKIGITCYPTYGGSGAVATELGLDLANRGHEAVVEGDHVLDAGHGHGVEHGLGLLGGAAQRLLAEDVLAGLSRRHRDRAMVRAGGRHNDRVHGWIG